MTVRGGLVAVGVGQPVGLSAGEEPRVLLTVVADRNGLPAEVDDLDPVRVTGLFADLVVVVASVNRIHRGGGHRVTGLLVRRVEHRAALPDVDSGLIHGTRVHRR
jgi:hypothetical protein